jgi:hypothetical protein
MIYHAIIAPETDGGVNHRTTVEAESEAAAIAALEFEHGSGRVLEVWLDHEQSKLLGTAPYRLN